MSDVAYRIAEHIVYNIKQFKEEHTYQAVSPKIFIKNKILEVFVDVTVEDIAVAMSDTKVKLIIDFYFNEVYDEDELC